MKKVRVYIALVLVIIFSAGIVGCASEPAVTASAADLMDGIGSRSVSGRTADDELINSMANFSVELFKRSIDRNENSLISPVSVMLALAMTANGADSETLSQMETLLGGDIPLSELNEYLYSYINALPSSEKSKLNIANSIWFRDDESLEVFPDFLQTNADFYNAAIYKSAFDSQTLNEVNNWVKENTDGMIDSILTQINPLDMLYLINAVAFDAEWQNVYYENNVKDGIFTNIHGNEKTVDFMHSTEYIYKEDDMATGFIKPYVGNSYSFAVLLPNEGISIENYIESLTGESLINTIQNSSNETVYAALPKFEFDFDISMNEVLSELGMPDAFNENKADFSKMANYQDGNIFISSVIHKTFISVHELGTRAGAATMVAMAGSGAPMETKIVTLDRPFVFAIIDNTTNLPLFIGTLTDI